MKTENLPPGSQRPHEKYVTAQEAAASETSKGGKSSARLAVGDIISVKVEQQLTAGRVLVSSQGNRFTALTDINLRQGEIFKAFVESLGAEIKLKPLIAQVKNLEQKLTAEVKSLIGDKGKPSDTVKWVKNLASESKGETAAKSSVPSQAQASEQTTTKARTVSQQSTPAPAQQQTAAAGQTTAKSAAVPPQQQSTPPVPQQSSPMGQAVAKTGTVPQQPVAAPQQTGANLQTTAPLTRGEVAAKAEATLNMLKETVAAAKEGQAAPKQASPSQNAVNPFAKMASSSFTQTKYLQTAAEEPGAKTEKALNLGTLLANEKAGPIIRENVALLEKIIDRTLLVPENKLTKNELMGQMRDSGLQLEKKIGDLVREGAHHEFPKMAANDLKGQLLKLKGELQQMEQNKALNLPANVRDEINALQKEISAKINNIELSQVLNTISRDRDSSMLFQIPFMQNEEIKNSVLEYKRNKSKNKDGPDELAISFFLEMSNIGELRIDGLLRKKTFLGIINVTSDEAAQVFRENISGLSQAIEGHGIAANIGIKKVAPQEVVPPENTDFLKSDEFRDSILDLKV